MKTLSPDIWLKQLTGDIENTKAAMKEVAVKTIYTISMNIRKMTPVDSGQARNSWQTSSTSSVIDNVNKNTQDTTFYKEINSLYGGWIYFVSANPYMQVLEHGGYPVPVKKGTRLKDGSYEIRSHMGHSKQAPEGMVSKSIVNFRFYLAEEIRRAKRKRKL